MPETFTPKDMERPPLTLDVGIEGFEPIKMTYGLQMDLQRLLPDPGSATEMLLTNAYMLDYVVRRVMTDKKGTITKEEDLVSMEDVDLDPDQIKLIIDWVVKHILYFFVKRANLLVQNGLQFKEALPTQFTTGFPTLDSVMPAAGPSAA
ncbi:hypothetical protein [Sphingomonas sp.]|uniref:hypothetical protein n=1 Tax=Sphingomonas sp. TaxID=28214 RepID=UPI003F7FE676